MFNRNPSQFLVKYFLTWICFPFLLATFTKLLAQDIPPKPTDYVNDYADILSTSEERRLRETLRAYEDSTSNQIIVATFSDAQGYPVEDFSIRLAEKWKVGHAGRDNGIILAVFQKEHRIRIEVGYGLEDMVPDATAYQIIRTYIRPHFRKGNYYRGIRDGIAALMAGASGKFEAFHKKRRRRNKPGRMNPAAILIFLFLVILMLRMGRRRGFTATSGGWRGNGPFFWGGFGGGSGGGFSAGGGGFGGGGATGSW